jgi:hypothetical protein
LGRPSIASPLISLRLQTPLDLPPSWCELMQCVRIVPSDGNWPALLCSGQAIRRSRSHALAQYRDLPEETAQVRKVVRRSSILVDRN